MTAGVSAVTLAIPILAAQAVFATRRVNRGIDAMDENPVYAAANLGIASGQVLKGLKAVNSLAMTADPTLASVSEGAKNLIKQLSDTNKTLGTIAKGAAKGVNIISNNVNPVIIGAGALKVAGADDKLDEAARESTRLLCMFGAEAGAKALIGMPYLDKIGKETVLAGRDGILNKQFNNLFKGKQMNALKDFVSTKEFMKYVPNKIAENLPKVFNSLPSILKGVAFVSASIIGYKIGDKVATAILGKKETKKEN